MYSVTLKELIDEFKLKNLTADVNIDNKSIEIADVNRPALQLLILKK